LNRALSAAMQRWIEYHEAIKEQKRVAKRAMMMWKNRELTKAMLTWEDWYAAIKEQQRRLKIALMRWMKGAMARGWLSWQDWYEHVVWQRQMIEKSAARWRNRKLGMAFSAMREYPAWLRRSKQLLDKAARRIRFLKEAKSFKQWKRFLRNARVLRERLGLSKQEGRNIQKRLHDRRTMSRELAEEYEALEKQIRLSDEAEMQCEEAKYAIESFTRENAEMNAELHHYGKPAVGKWSSWRTDWQRPGEWEPVYDAVCTKNQQEFQVLRGMFVMAVMMNLNAKPAHRAFKAWASGEMDPREILCRDLEGLHHSQMKLMGTLLRPIGNC